VNDAGIDGELAPLADQPSKSWHRVIEVNLSKVSPASSTGSPKPTGRVERPNASRRGAVDLVVALVDQKCIQLRPTDPRGHHLLNRPGHSFAWFPHPRMSNNGDRRQITVASSAWSPAGTKGSAGHRA